MEGTTHETKHVLIQRNFCRMNGKGWGCPGRAQDAPMLSLGKADTVRDYVIKNNIFDRSLGLMVLASDSANQAQFSYDGNTFVQYSGGRFGVLYGKEYDYNENAAAVVHEILRDQNAVIMEFPQ